MNSFHIAEKVSSNVQEFYEKWQVLILSVVDINQLRVFENIIHNIRDINNNELSKLIQCYEIKIHDLQCRIQYKEKLRTRDETLHHRLIYVTEVKHKYVLIQG